MKGPLTVGGLGQEWWGMGSRWRPLICRLRGRGCMGRQRCPKDVHTAGGAGLLPLEPGAQAAGGQDQAVIGRSRGSASQSHSGCPGSSGPLPPGMENVVAGQSLGTSHHLFSADNADIVHRLQFLWGGVWIPGQNRPRARQDQSWRQGTQGRAWASSWDRPTYSVFMLRIARRDMMASVTAFLNCLRGQFQ